MKQPHFEQVDKNPQKFNVENFLVRQGQKWVWPIWSLDYIKCTVSQE